MHSGEGNSIMIQRLLNRLSKSQISKLQTTIINKKLISDIRKGKLQIPDITEDYDSYINHQAKQDSLKKIYNSQEFYNYERDYKIMMKLPQPADSVKMRNRKIVVKEEQKMKQLKSDQQIRRQFIRKLKNWQQQRVKLAKRKKNNQMKRQLLQNSSQEKRKREEQQINAFLKLQKQKIIQAKIRDIQDRRAKRNEILQQSQVKGSQSLPKFVQYQNRFKKQQLRKSLQEKILLKNRKVSLQMKMEEIKQHEKAYIQRIKDRLKIKSNNSNNNNKSTQNLSKSVEESFNVNKKDINELKKHEQKLKRIKKFQSKIRLLPLKIDEEKKREMLIMNDKLKNPKKYHFLSQKALSDQQIYQQFKDFDINIDKKQIGNQYFDEFRENNRKGLSKRKVISQKVLPERHEYKNYIQQMRQNKRQILNPDQYQNYANKAKKMINRQHGKEFLRQKSELHDKKTIQKIGQLQRMDKYQDSIRKQEQIDDHFTKAIKAKIALANLQ